MVQKRRHYFLIQSATLTTIIAVTLLPPQSITHYHFYFKMYILNMCFCNIHSPRKMWSSAHFPPSLLGPQLRSLSYVPLHSLVYLWFMLAQVNCLEPSPLSLMIQSFARWDIHCIFYKVKETWRQYLSIFYVCKWKGSSLSRCMVDIQLATTPDYRWLL